MSRPVDLPPGEPHRPGLAAQLNWLRAGVLGANDGIVSVAALLVGVASATNSLAAIVAAGVAAVIGGAVSMALGEYVSVSSARDQQYALIEKEKQELIADPEAELNELTALYVEQGLSAAEVFPVAGPSGDQASTAGGADKDGIGRVFWRHVELYSTRAAANHKAAYINHAYALVGRPLRANSVSFFL